MIIKCYLFSDRTRQLGHTYYSTGMGSYLYFELSSYQDTAYISKPFVYEVEVDTDKILYCDSESVRSIEYKISREVEFNEYIFTFTLPKNDLKELLNILDGNIDKNEMIEFYTSIISKDVYKVNRFDQLKFFAILNQTIFALISGFLTSLTSKEIFFQSFLVNKFSIFSLFSPVFHKTKTGFAV